jgi:hypothetical protein
VVLYSLHYSIQRYYIANGLVTGYYGPLRFNRPIAVTCVQACMEKAAGTRIYQNLVSVQGFNFHFLYLQRAPNSRITAAFTFLWAISYVYEKWLVNELLTICR